ncbi:hypothetical protein P4647_25510 [Peribacillus frigoritolerans]|uniref:hypothetical protein n=1 Tax=Peribacillus frigoritolerans TaxID=450367 RepID=UPI002E206232|nr:hypothetical protein [Peribacillus frigoritolerans]
MGYLEETIEELEKQIDQLLSPYRKEVELLDGIPGVNKAAALLLLRRWRLICPYLSQLNILPLGLV